MSTHIIAAQRGTERPAFGGRLALEYAGSRAGEEIVVLREKSCSEDGRLVLCITRGKCARSVSASRGVAGSRSEFQEWSRSCVRGLGVWDEVWGSVCSSLSRRPAAEQLRGLISLY